MQSFKPLIYCACVFLLVSAEGYAEEDSIIADDLYTKPLTYRSLPIGYRQKPFHTTTEPRNFKDNPNHHQIDDSVRNFRDNPFNHQLLDTVRNFEPDPPRFTERDQIVQANTDTDLQVGKDETLQAADREELRIETQTFEATRIADSFKERNRGYPDENPPEKVRLSGYQSFNDRT